MCICLMLCNTVTVYCKIFTPSPVCLRPPDVTENKRGKKASLLYIVMFT